MSRPFVFTADTNIEEALGLDPRVAETFRRLGLKCIECAAAPVERLRHAALYHEKPLDEVLRALNELGIKEKK